MSRHRRGTAPALLAVLLLCTSCGLFPGLRWPPGNGPKKSGPASAPAKPSARERDLLLARAAALLEAGEYEAAFDRYKGIRERFGPDARVDEACLEAFEEVYRRAAAGLDGGDCEAAGETYYLLDRKLAALGDISARLSFTAWDVESGLLSCRRLLSLRGLEHYRRGDLPGAVASWKSLLRFDPGNEEIRKAVETSTTQMEELRRQDPPPAGE